MIRMSAIAGRKKGRVGVRWLQAHQSAGVPTVSESSYDYDRASHYAGVAEQAPDKGYRVEYRRLPRWRPVRTTALALCMPLLAVGFLVWLLLPSHWPNNLHSPFLTVVSFSMLGSIAILEVIRIINIATLCLATVLARDPIPVVPERGTRVAFVTTIVPSREPFALVERTLRAALQLRHDGELDVWLLDEGCDAEVRSVCAALGVHHFSRRDVPEWNLESGPHRARTKHGNLNAWLIAHGADYDFVIGVDPDHVPMPIMCERLLGYFRDPDVAFVVGPQVYGNYDNFVTKSAESQQYLFHSLLQRAANRTRSAMLVGTNYAIRTTALRDIGGFQDSITEDMATSLAIHSTANARTGERWRSVYTPDVLAVGEGPASWTDYFAQQSRWSRGTDDVFLRRFWSSARRLSPRELRHYFLLLSFYPLTAFAWILGILNLAIYFLIGAGGVVVPAAIWLMFYVDVAICQVGVYVWNRRHNVSPHELEGSSGVSGMLISVLALPIYCSSLIATIRKKQQGFSVTPKGETTSRDTLRTFRCHLRWAALLVFLLGVSVWRGHAHVSMRFWALVSLAFCLVPVAIWRIAQWRRDEQQEIGWQAESVREVA